MTSPWIRKLLIGAGVFVLLIAAVLTYLIATFDPNAYKGVAIDWMKTERQRTLAINGPIKLAVFPRLAVQISGVTLTEKNKPDTFLELSEAALSVAVLPLLRQQIVVDSVRAKGLHVSFQRSDDGASNIDDLLKSEPTPEKTDKKPESSSPLRFDVSRIELEDFRLSLRDEKAKLQGEVALAKLTTGRLADQVESKVVLKAHVALTAPAVQGDLDGDTQLLLDLANKGVRLRDMALGWKGKLPGAESVDLSLRGALAYDGAKGTLQADKVELAGDAALGTLRLVKSTLAIDRFAYDPANQALQLAKLRIKLGGTSSGHPMSLDIDWPQLAVQRESLTGSPLSGQISLQGPTTVEASFKTAAPSGSFQRIVVPNVESTLKGRSGPRALSGTFQATLLLQPAQGAIALEGLNTQLQLQEPSLQPLAITVQGKADASAQSAHWALKGQINGNPYVSDGTAILATEPLTLNASARFDSLDLNRLLPPSATAEPAVASGPGGAPPPATDTPVDLSPLRALQGKFDLRIGQFAYQTYRLSDLLFTATLDGGMLRVSTLSGKGWGGSFVANAFADARASRIALAGSASGVNVNALLKDVAKKDLLEGTGRVVLDVDSAGRSVKELKSRLQGKAALQLRDGAIKGVNLAKSLRQAKATLGMKTGDERQKASQTEKTDFSELSATFTIANGVARSSDLDMKSPFLRLGGDGALDIGRGQIDYTARATVASTTKGQDGADLAALKGLTIPVHLTGPFEAMDWQIRWSAIATQLLKTEVGGKLEAQAREALREKLRLPGAASAASGTSGQSLEDAAKDKVKEKLKGLFK